MNILADITKSITEFLSPLNDFVNGALGPYVWYVAFAMLVSAALFFLWKFKGAQFVTIKDQLKSINPMRNTEIGKQVKNHRITPFQAFCVGLGARVGIGNITGVTSAIIMGGAGAVFWMWIFALLGGGLAFVESILGQMFKEKKADGTSSEVLLTTSLKDLRAGSSHCLLHSGSYSHSE